MAPTLSTRPQLDALLTRFLTAVQLCGITGLDAAFVAACGARLHASGVWQDRQSVSAIWWQDHGALALLCDILVALGRIRRVVDDATIRWTAALHATA